MYTTPRNWGDVVSVPRVTNLLSAYATQSVAPHENGAPVDIPALRVLYALRNVAGADTTTVLVHY